MLLSTSSLFAEEVHKESLTQLKEDSQLKLPKNLSTSMGGKQSASAASFSGARHASSTSGPQAYSRFSKNSSGSSKGS